MTFINFVVIFHMVFFSFAHWRFVFSKILCLDTVDHLLLGRTFAFGLRTENLKTFKKI